jgi:PII-like signaling protein
VDEECTVLTSYLPERQRAEGVPSSGVFTGLYAGRRTATSILLRGIEGSGRQQPRAGRSFPQASESALTAIAVDTRLNIEAVLDETLRLARPRLVTIERARLLSGEIEPVRLGEEPGDATRLTVYCRQRDRAHQIPAFEAACELLYRRRIAGATVLSGVDGADPAHARPQHARFLRRDADVPLMVVAVGAGDRIAMLLPELGAMFRRPLMTIEKVRLCKRDGLFVSRPETAPGAAHAQAGMTAQFKLTVYTSEAARHDGNPVHRGIVHSLNSAGISGATTVRGIWGYHGDHAPHGDHFPRPARHVPVVTTVIAAAEQVSAAFDAIDSHTAERGLVTAETVLAARPTANAPSPGLPKIKHLVQPGRRRTTSRPARPATRPRSPEWRNIGSCHDREPSTCSLHDRSAGLCVRPGAGRHGLLHRAHAAAAALRPGSRAVQGRSRPAGRLLSGRDAGRVAARRGAGRPARRAPGRAAWARADERGDAGLRVDAHRGGT